jgi:MFS family permease
VFGPALGLLVNCLAYLPLFLWLFVTPYTGHRSEGQPSRAGVGLKDLVDVLRQVSSNRTVLSMIALTGLASLFVGNAMQAQMPEFAHDLSHHHGSDERAGAGYTALQTAQAAGAVFGGFALEVTRMVPTSPRTAIVAGALFGVAVAAFAGSTNYWLALALLFAVGMLRLTYGSMAQALVQIHAPQALRGRVLGVFSIAQNGLQAGSGFTVGVMGTMVGVHWSTAASAIILVASVAALYLLLFGPRRGTSGAD